MQRTTGTRFGLGLLLGTGAMIAAAPTASAQNCITDTTAGVRELPAASCGLDMTLSVPQACTAAGSSCGLILQFHGIALKGVVQERNTNLQRLAAEGDVPFVVLTPTAAVQGPIRRFLTADTERIRSVALEAVQKLALNPNRVHVEGFSQGGGLAIDFVCRFSDMLASASVVAPAGLGQPELLEANCFQGGMGPKLPIQITQGSQDELVDPASTSALLDRILAANGLDRTQGTVIDMAERITQTRFMSTQGTEIQFIAHEFDGASVGVGHCIPGSFEDPANLMEGTDGGLLGIGQRGSIGCADTDVIRSGPEALEFFIANPKR
jgi:poly(3-hydroxybutyrate) depolymerase